MQTPSSRLNGVGCPYFSRLKPLWAVRKPHFNRLSGNQAVQAGAPQRDHMNKNVTIRAVRAHEAEAFMRIKPLHRRLDEVGPPQERP